MRFTEQPAVRELWISAASNGIKAYLRRVIKHDRALGTMEACRLSPLVTRFADNKDLDEIELSEIFILVLFADDCHSAVKEEAFLLLA